MTYKQANRVVQFCNEHMHFNNMYKLLLYIDSYRSYGYISKPGKIMPYKVANKYDKLIKN